MISGRAPAVETNGFVAGTAYGDPLTRVDAEDAAEEVVQRLTGDADRDPGRTRAAVADTDVEEAVGAELHHAAVVVGGRLDEREQHPALRAVDRVRVAGGAVVLDHANVAVAVVEVRVDEPARRVVGSEGDREKPLLAVGVDDTAEIQERVGLQHPVLDQRDEAGLLHDEDAGRVARGRDDERRRGEFADERQPEMADHRGGATVREHPDRADDRRKLPVRGRRRSECLHARGREPHRERRSAARHDQMGAKLADDLEVTRPRGAVLDGEHHGPCRHRVPRHGHRAPGHLHANRDRRILLGAGRRCSADGNDGGDDGSRPRRTRHGDSEAVRRQDPPNLDSRSVRKINKP